MAHQVQPLASDTRQITYQQAIGQDSGLAGIYVQPQIDYRIVDVDGNITLYQTAIHSPQLTATGIGNQCIIKVLTALSLLVGAGLFPSIGSAHPVKTISVQTAYDNARLKKAPIDSAITTDAKLTAQAFAEKVLPANAAYKIVANLTEAKVAATDGSLKYLIISDGEHHVVVTKGSTGTDIGIAGWAADFTKAGYAPFVAFHEQTTSSADIAAELNTAMSKLASTGLALEMPEGKTFVVGSEVIVKADLHGNGTTLIAKPGIVEAVLKVQTNSSGIDINGITLDMRALPIYDGTSTGIAAGRNGSTYAISGILAAGVSDSVFSGNTIIGASYAGMTAKASSTQSLQNMTIANNIITMAEGARFSAHFNEAQPFSYSVSYGISISGASKGGLSATSTDAELQTAYSRIHGGRAAHMTPAELALVRQAFNYKGASDLNSLYVAAGVMPDSIDTLAARQVRITGNSITGGRYGLSFSFTSGNEVTGNSITDNVRNISIQNNTSGNTISGNLLTQAGSTGLLMGYNSDNNTVKNNIITSTVATGQSMIMIDEGSERNTIVGNRIETAKTRGPDWLIYAGADVGGNTISDNILSGVSVKSSIAVEGMWNYDTQKGESASWGNTPQYDNRTGYIYYNGGGNVPTDGVTISNNIVASDSKISTGIYLGADGTQDGGADGMNQHRALNGSLTNLTVRNNALLGAIGTHYKNGITAHENGATIHMKDGSSIAAGVRLDSRGLYQSGSTVYSNHSMDSLPGNAAVLYLLGSQAVKGVGNNAGNTLYGNLADNILIGGTGNDVLIGGGGKDTLTGGAGQDTFLIKNIVLDGSNISTITDFNAEQGDKIALSKVVFGTLKGNWFAAQGEPVTSETRVIQRGGQLYYDADGSGTAYAEVHFATVNSATPLKKENFTPNSVI